MKSRKRTFSRILAVLLTGIIAVGGGATPALAADVDFNGQGASAVWNYDTIGVKAYGFDAFGAAMKDLAPGAERSVSVQLRNNTDDEVEFRLVAEPLTGEKARELESHFPGKTADDSLLDVINIKVSHGATQLYAGTMRGLASNGNADLYASAGVSLGRVSAAYSGLITVTLSIPSSLGSEAMNTLCAVEWRFVATQYEGVDSGNHDPAAVDPEDPDPENPDPEDPDPTTPATVPDPEDPNSEDPTPGPDDSTPNPEAPDSDAGDPESNPGPSTPASGSSGSGPSTPASGSAGAGSNPTPSAPGGGGATTPTTTAPSATPTAPVASADVIPAAGVVPSIDDRLLVELPDAATPSSSGPDVTIEADSVPMSGAEQAWAQMNLALTVASGILMLGLLGRLIIAWVYRTDEDDEDEEELRRDQKHFVRKVGAWLISLVAVLATTLLFVFTEDMSLPMVTFNGYTIIYACVVSVELLVIVLSFIKPKASHPGSFHPDHCPPPHSA